MPSTKPRTTRTAAAARRKAQGDRSTQTGQKPRRSNKVSDYVALDIVRDIVSRNLKPGDKLPPEPELLRQYQVSRSTLREAMRVLEVQGLVHSRPGPGGGTVVGKVEVSSLARTLTLHMHLLGTTYDELLASYVLAESMTAELAAVNPDRELVQRLMQPYVEEGPHEHAVAEGFTFHQTVAILANNRLLGFILQTPGAIVNDHLVTTLNRKVLEDHVIHDHTRIAAAIISGNPKKAYLTMHEHVERLVEYFRAAWPQKVGDKIEWR
jgi:GntR family transcriptional repressor for pyruvate dehydrogenase complex